MKDLNVWKSVFAALLQYGLTLILFYGLGSAINGAFAGSPGINQSPWFPTTINLIVSLTGLILIVLFIRWYGFKMTIFPKSWKEVNWLLLIFVVILGLGYFYLDLVFIKGLSLIENFPPFEEIKTGGSVFHFTSLPFLTTLVIIAPLSEELFFRGFIMEGMLRNKNNFLPLITSSVLFALTHFYPGDTADNNIQRITMTFLFSLFAGSFYWKSRYVIYPIIFHVTANLTNTMASYYEIPVF